MSRNSRRNKKPNPVECLLQPGDHNGILFEEKTASDEPPNRQKWWLLKPRNCTYCPTQPEFLADVHTRQFMTEKQRFFIDKKKKKRRRQ